MKVERMTNRTTRVPELPKWMHLEPAQEGKHEKKKGKKSTENEEGATTKQRQQRKEKNKKKEKEKRGTETSSALLRTVMLKVGI